MKLKKLFHVFVVILMFSMVFAQTSMAKADDSKKANGKRSLVALGDSISFGYNLEVTNNAPSQSAFPAVIASEEKLRQVNLSVVGLTSTNLLPLLKTESYRSALLEANVITLDIGSNDFLQGAKPIIDKLVTTPGYQPTQADMLLIGAITQQFGVNLSLIIQEIRTLTDAPIVLYTLYNPFYGLDAVAGAMLVNANQLISSYDPDPSIVVSDSFSVFAGHQNTLILPGDVHPNSTGQLLLAKIGEQAIETLPKKSLH
ncbi:GDSL-type esterase/lipase family protein [Paenibacillus cremeus]|uniref:SGNH/GDSL hydrolase family protein n=1 Tax=Paenibacillus cremeus TaxID=2163881 RepID=A0A559K7C1_9BACL|nr:GDSL-type esterase/lipase family protein [Paenibacillus cremeus]TVY08026.1 SGNH/GDSL hydrolase family protein [Paenibacillus cremeus]